MPGTAQLRVRAEACQSRSLRHVVARLQGCLGGGQADAAQVLQRRDARMLQKQPVQVPGRGVRHLGHGAHVPERLGLLAHGILHAVQGAVQVVAVVQKGRELRVLRAAPQGHHHGLGHLGGNRRAADVGNAVQHQVNAGGHPGTAVQCAVVHEDPVGHHVAVRVHQGQLTQVLVVRGGTPAGQQPGVGGQHRARADGDQLQPARGQAHAAQPVQQVAGLAVVYRDGLARQTHQHHPGRLGQGGGQGLQPGQYGAHRGHRLGPGAREVLHEALRLALGAQQLVGDAQGLGRAGPVQHQAAGQQGEVDVDGRRRAVHGGACGAYRCSGARPRRLAARAACACRSTGRWRTWVLAGSLPR